MWAKEKELEEKVVKFLWSIFRIQFEKMLEAKYFEAALVPPLGPTSLSNPLEESNISTTAHYCLIFDKLMPEGS
jgi:hypothetical protein